MDIRLLLLLRIGSIAIISYCQNVVWYLSFSCYKVLLFTLACFNNDLIITPWWSPKFKNPMLRDQWQLMEGKRCIDEKDNGKEGRVIDRRIITGTQWLYLPILVKRSTLWMKYCVHYKTALDSILVVNSAVLYSLVKYSE